MRKIVGDSEAVFEKGGTVSKEQPGELSCTQHRIEEPVLSNKDKEHIALLRQAIRDARYIHGKYGKEHPNEAWETIGLILNDPKLKAKGGTH